MLIHHKPLLFLLKIKFKKVAEPILKIFCKRKQALPLERVRMVMLLVIDILFVVMKHAATCLWMDYEILE